MIWSDKEIGSIDIADKFTGKDQRSFMRVSDIINVKAFSLEQLHGRKWGGEEVVFIMVFPQKIIEWLYSLNTLPCFSITCNHNASIASPQH